MLGAGEAGEIGTDLRHQRLGHGATDAGDGIQPCDRLLIGLHALRDLGTDPGDGRLQEVDVGHLLGHQEALVRPDAPD